MKRKIFAVATLCASALCLSGCAGLANYITPNVQADQAIVAADTVTVNNDLLKARSDFVSNRSGLPADGATLVADQALLARAFAQLVADLKTVGKPAPPTPAAITTAPQAS
jgi:hypothetical protein